MNWLMNHTYKEILKYVVKKNLFNSRIIAEVDAKLEIFLLKKSQNKIIFSNYGKS